LPWDYHFNYREFESLEQHNTVLRDVIEAGEYPIPPVEYYLQGVTIGSQ